MLTRNYLTLLLFGLLGCVQAQPYQEDWDTPLGDYARDAALLNMMQAPDGAVYAVGEFRAVSNDLDGMLIQLDESTGQVLQQPQLSRDGNDGFRHMIDGPAGGFWLVGYGADTRGEGRYPRLLQLDYRLSPIEDRVFTDLPEEVFTQVGAFASGQLLLVGRRTEKRNEIPTFYWLKNDELVPVPALKDWQDRLLDVAAVLPSPDQRTLYIIGNSRRGRYEEEGRVYLLALTEEGARVRSFPSPDGAYVYARAAALSPEADILLTGEMLEPGRTRLWAATFSPSASTFTTHETEGSTSSQAGYAIGAVPEGHQLLLCQTDRLLGGVSFREQQMMRGNALLPFAPFHTLSGANGFTAGSSVLTYGRRFLLGGTQEGRNRTEPRCLSLAPVGMYSSSRGRVSAECSQPRFQFDNGDNQLSPGESVDIAFEVTNTGDDPIWEGKVLVTANPLAAGIILPRREVFIGALGVGVTRTVRIPVVASQALSAGQSSLQFQVMTGQQLLDQRRMDFRSTIGTGLRTTLLTVDYPSQTSPDRAFPSATDTFTIRVKTFSDHALERENFRPVQNGNILQDSKDMDTRLSEAQRQNDLYTQTYTLRVRLREGLNEIRLAVDDFGDPVPLDPVYIEYQPLRPNLHVLAIAPDYTGFENRGFTTLRFNDDDARDFVAAVSRQQGGGIYRRVFVDTLWEAGNTDNGTIERALEDLERRTLDPTREDFIAENDVVMVFISGHGDLLNDRDFAIIPSNYDPVYERSTSLDYERDILRYLEPLRRKTLLFIDACHSGGDGGKGTGVDSLTSAALFRLNQATTGMLAFQSCREGENSYENDRWRNGAFTEALLEALRGEEIQLEGGLATLRADANRDGFLSLKELMDYTGSRVPLLLQQAGLDFQQHPQVTDIDDRQRFELGLDFFRVLTE